MNPIRRILLAAAIAFAAVAPGASAWSFGTIDGLGQHSEHRRITLWALSGLGFEPETLRRLAGRGGFSFGAVGAPDNPWRGLAGFRPAHCDGGDYLDTPGYRQDAVTARGRLEDCRRWIFAQIDQAVTDAGGVVAEAGRQPRGPCRFDGRRLGSAKCLTLEDLGLALHAAQDFYAHTNWVDRPAAGPAAVNNPPGLGQAGAAPWLDQSPASAFPDGLISGCYDGFPEIFHCGALTTNPRIPHRNLEKDTGPIDPEKRWVGRGTTSRGRINGNFERAVAAAVAETQARWSDFERQVVERYGPQKGRTILCLIKSDQWAACPG